MRWKTWAVLGILLLGAGLALGRGRLAGTAAAAWNAEGVVPIFEPDPLFFEALPNRWVTGQVGGVAVDRHDNIWVFHRPASVPEGQRLAALDPPQAECCHPAPPVVQFDSRGRFVQAWGGPGDGYEWPATEHGIFVDHQDNVWLSGSAGADNQILKFAPDGRFLLQIGRAGANSGSNDTTNVGGPADLFVHPASNEVFVADGYVNRRVIVFDAGTGAYERHWGAYGNRPDDDEPIPSREELIGRLARGEAPPTQFATPVHAIFVSNDELVYVADRGNLRLQVFQLDGAFVTETFLKPNTLYYTGTVHEIGASPDPDQRFLYIVDGANKWVHVLDRRSLEVLYGIGGHGGHNAREFFHAHSFATDSQGNLYIGEVNDGQRYYRYRFTGMGPAPTAP